MAYTPDDFAPIASTDLGRAALLWVLWRHQGASSSVGQPIRFAMGMGAFDELTDEQIAQAKLWDATPPQPVTPAGGEVDVDALALQREIDGRPLPLGWVAVPMEATEEMEDALRSSEYYCENCKGYGFSAENGYRNMIAAAPKLAGGSE